MTTLREKPVSELGQLLQQKRTDRPDEWSMDEFTRMAEKLQAENEELKIRISDGIASLGQMPEFLDECSEGPISYDDAQIVKSEIGEAILRLKGEYANKLEGKQ